MILKGAKPVRRDGVSTSYQKHADLEQMIKDFWSVNPTNVNNNVVGGINVGRTGKIGDRTIKYYGYDGLRLSDRQGIMITKTDRHQKVIKEDFIRYTD